MKKRPKPGLGCPGGPPNVVAMKFLLKSLLTMGPFAHFWVARVKPGSYERLAKTWRWEVEE